ncbi:STAS-like domain-containing protein [Negadavirga shengliensis]|uniref:STAS-like domain-containing protein n=1 Tax=Negadavirga shengliensis TaxID=1389218 RepID=A0ABV9T9I0_9BACT
MRIRFRDIGESLGTRVLGEQIRRQIEASFEKEEFVSFDFEGVSVISHSFADECFGKLLLNRDLEDIKSLSTFLNANDLVRKTIAITLKERLDQKPAA